MALYYVNKKAQVNGDHEVHKSGCPYMPEDKNKQPLGDCDNCHEAVSKAKNYYTQVNGCYYCSKECHTQ